MKKGTITIRYQGPQGNMVPLAVQGYVGARFGIHRTFLGISHRTEQPEFSTFGWVVCHLETGFEVSWTQTLIGAYALVAYLESCGDVWDGDEDAVAAKLAKDSSQRMVSLIRRVRGRSTLEVREAISETQRKERVNV